MVQVTLKVVAVAMTMIVGLAMSLATFITYGRAAFRMVADITGPLACTRSFEVFNVPPKCAASGHPCYQVYVKHTAPAAGGGRELRESLLHPYLSDYNASANVACADKECSLPSWRATSKRSRASTDSSGPAQKPSGDEDKAATDDSTWNSPAREPTGEENKTVVDASAQQTSHFLLHFLPVTNASYEFECYLDASLPGHAFARLERENARERRYFGRLESIVILSAPSAVCLAVLIALFVFCISGVLSSSPVLKEQVNSSYIKIGDKYYMQMSSEGSPAATMT